MSEIVKITKASGTAVPIRGNDIDTDRIIPARYLKEVTFARMGEYPFFDERFDAAGKKKDHPFNDPEYKGASLLFVNKNFGCGSSREHAPQALMRFGFKAFVGGSFAEIFAGNCTSLGLPCVTLPADQLMRLMDSVELDPGQRVKIDLRERTVTSRAGSMTAGIPDGVRMQLMEGTWDATRVLLEAGEAIERTARGIAYF